MKPLLIFAFSVLAIMPTQKPPTLAGPEVKSVLASPIQDALTVGVAVVKVEQKKSVVSRSTSVFDGEAVHTSETIVSTKTVATLAALLTTSEKATLTAYDSQFNAQSVAELKDNRFLLSAPPGRYLVIVNTGTKSAVAIAVIPGPVPDPPTPEDPTPPDTESLAALSADLANRLNDQPTRSAMATALDSLEFTGDYSQAKEATQAAVRSVLAARQGRKQVDWLNGWRRPLQTEMQRLGVDSKASYVKAIGQIVDGLKKPPAESKTKTTIRRPVARKPRPVGRSPPRRRLINNTLQQSPTLIPYYVQHCENGICYPVLKYYEVVK